MSKKLRGRVINGEPYYVLNDLIPRELLQRRAGGRVWTLESSRRQWFRNNLPKGSIITIKVEKDFRYGDGQKAWKFLTLVHISALPTVKMWIEAKLRGVDFRSKWDRLPDSAPALAA